MRPSERFSSLIQYWSERVNLPPDRITRQVGVESSFNPRAVSPAGAIGLMQLMPGTARDLGCLDPYNPDENLKAGTAYMAKILADVMIRSDAPPDDQYRMALAGYNAGPGYVYECLRLLGSGPTDWLRFIARFPEAAVRGRTPRAKDALHYATTILPLGD